MNQLTFRIQFLFLIIFCCQLLSCKDKKSIENQSIKIQIVESAIPEEQKVDCKIKLFDKEGLNILNAGIEKRGSSSSFYPKRSYSVRFKNSMPIKFQGIEISGDWVLYAPYADRSCIRNKLAETLFNDMGHYNSKSVFTELYVGNEYRGVYELSEKIGLHNKGLDQAKCIFKIDKLSGKKREMRSSLLSPEVKIQVHDLSPKYSVEDAFLSVRNFEKALSDSGTTFEKYAVMNSLVDYFLFSEFANSPDAYRSSCYFQVQADGRIKMGPIWDYDLAFGNSNLYFGQQTKGWRFPISESKSPYYSPSPIWWSLLFKKPTFRSALLKRWSDLRKEDYSDRRLNQIVDSLSNNLQPLLIKNFKKWPVIAKPIKWVVLAQNSYPAELMYLKNYLIYRAKWMDRELNKNRY